MIELSRYTFEVLSKDEELILYRGRSKEVAPLVSGGFSGGGAPHAGNSETARTRIFS